jgi:cytochrome c biogenesis protein CcmG/thiol:disulfide interchange protein DsbE
VQSFVKVELDDGTEVTAWLPQDDELWHTFQEGTKQGRIRVDVSYDGEFWRFERISTDIPEPTPMSISSADREKIELTAYDGPFYSNEDLQGKVVVVNFWMSRSPACENQVQVLEKIWQANKGKDFLILGVNYGDNESDAKAFLDNWNVTYPAGPDTDSKLSMIFKITGVPETFVLDRDGNVVRAISGPTSYEELAEVIDSQLERVKSYKVVPVAH